MLLSALLHLKGIPVAFQPRASAPCGGRIRVNLPGGRLLVEGLDPEPSDGASPFLLAMEGSGPMDREAFKRLMGRPARPQQPSVTDQDAPMGAFINTLRDGAERPDIKPSPWETCLVLAEPVMLDGACVELEGPEAAVVVPRGSRVAGLLSSLGSFGFSFHAVEDMSPYLDSYRVLKLLDLPVAMCNTTRTHFLSFPEGRQIAAHVLEEGLLACRKTGGKAGRLPVSDPTELMRRMGRNPRAFEAARFLPDRCFNPALQRLMRGGVLDPKGHNRRVVEKAAGAGLNLEWNWKLCQKVSRIHGAGFFLGPAELLAAIG